MSGNKAGNRKCFRTLAEGRERRSRDHIVWQTVPSGGSGDWKGPAVEGRQFDGRHRQTIGQSRAEGTPTSQISDRN